MHFIKLTTDNDKIAPSSVKPKLELIFSRLGFHKHSKWKTLYTFDEKHTILFDKDETDNSYKLSISKVEIFLNQVFKEIIGCNYPKDGLDTVKIEYWDFDDLLLLTPRASEYYMSKYLFSGKMKPNIAVTYQSPAIQAYQKLVDEFNRR